MFVLFFVCIVMEFYGLGGFKVLLFWLCDFIVKFSGCINCLG